LEEEAEIIINPNPVENVFALVHPLSGDGAEINIYDVVGNRQMTFKVGDGLNISNFDISKLKSGEYILEYLDDETRLLKKLIKQ
jgi:hypothetical protein